MSATDAVGVGMIAVVFLGLLAMLAAALRGSTRGVVVVGIVTLAMVGVGVLAMPDTDSAAHGGGGGHPRMSGVRTIVAAHQTESGTVIRDPWCEQSEDSCEINYRPSGEWVVRRVVP